MIRKIKFSFLKRPILYGFFVFIALLILTQFLTYQRYQLLKNTEQQEIIYHANWVEKEFQKILNQSFAANQTLSFIVENYGIPNNFDSIAKLLLETNKNLNALELVDSTGVITHVYPLEGNDILGFNILQDSIGKKGANITIRRKDYFVAGPIHLKQGGDGFVSRIPIFEGNSFKGFSATVIKLPDLINTLNLSASINNRFTYQIAKINADNAEELFFSSNKADIKDAHNITISMTNGEWKLYVISNNKVLFSTVFSFVILGLILSLLGGVFTWYLFRQPFLLDKKVKEKTLLLHESEEKYRTFVEEASDGIFLLDEKANILDANVQFCKMFGKTKKALLGINIATLIKPENLELIPLKISELTQGKTIRTLRKLIHSDGCVFCADVSVKMMPNKLYQGIMHDVTEREKATESIKKSELKYRELTTRITDAFIAFDKDWNLSYINPKALGFVGGDHNFVIGKYILELLPDVEKNETYKLLLNTMVTQEYANYVTFYEPFGIWVENHVYPSPEGVSVFFRDITNKIVAENKIVALQSKMESAIRIGKIGYWSWDIEKDKVEWSDRMYTIYDVDLGTPLNFEFVVSRIYPDDLNYYNDIVKKCSQTKENTSFNYRIVHRDKSLRHVSVQLEVLDNNKGEAIKFQGTVIDITDRVKAQAELQESQEKFFKSFHSNLIGKVIVDENRKILEANGTIADLLETTRENLIGKKLIDADVLDFNLHEQSEKRQLLWNKLLDQGFLSDEEITYTLKSGKQIPTLLSVEPLKLKNKTNFLVSAIDNTKRKEAEEELLKSEERFRKLASTTPVGIFQTDSAGSCTYVNEEWLKYSGMAYEEAMDYGWVNAIYPPDKNKVLKKWQKTVTEKKEFKLKFRFQHKNGEIIMISAKATPLYGIENNIVGYIGMASDITSLIKVEQELEIQNIELKKTNEELDRFVYSASHELRAPLASVLGLINIILSEEKEDGLVFKLEMMEKSVKRLDSFIKDIVQYSQNKHLDVASDKIDFSTLIQDSLESFWYLENRSKINIQTNISEEIDFYSDKKRISIILNNLISNAIKYHNIEKANPVIKIIVKTSEKFAHIEVRDNGVGIPSEHLDKIFNMFYRVSSKVMGTGIGLFVIKEIIEKINGKIVVKSEENKGTKFVITIPNQKK